MGPHVNENLPYFAATHSWAPTLLPGYVPCSLWIP